jgi:cysteine desulfurase/selenocysteine lyase
MIAGEAKLDAHKLRADFPIFQQRMHGKPLAYLDSAVSAQKPRQVLDTLREFYETSYSNVHRGVYLLAERATERFEGAREKVRALVNAASTREIVFTRSATEALNLVAYAWGLDNLGPGDLVVATELEHHSNFVPWQQIAKRTGATFRPIPVDGSGELQLDALDAIAKQGRVKVVANNLVSNALGTINPVEQLAAWAHEQGAIMVVDAAQAAPHRRIDVQQLGCDFLAFSSHKLCGPTGVGVLWGRAELLERMSPFNFGGEMIRKVTVEETSWNELPYKFEAGTPPIGEAVAMGAAIDYLNAIGIEAIEEHEHTLTAYTLERLVDVPGVHVFGPPAERRACHGRPSPRRRPDPRLGGRRDPRRPPLLPAADDQARRRRHEPRQLLPLHDPRRDRPPRRGPAQGQHDFRSGASPRRVRSSGMTYIIAEPCIDIMTPSHPSRRPVGCQNSGRARQRAVFEGDASFGTAHALGHLHVLRSAR